MFGLTLACSDRRIGGADQDPTALLADSELAFIAPVDGVGQIWLMRTDGSDRRQLSFGGGVKQSPTWSPTGDALAFVNTLDAEPCLRSGTLVIVTDEGSTELASFDRVVHSLAFDAANDGLFVVVDECVEPEVAGLHTSVRWYPLSGDDPETLASYDAIPALVASPDPGRYALSVGRWSPDPDSPTAWTHEPPDIFVGARGSGPPARIVEFDAFDTALDWHPAGERLAFQSDRYGEGAVYTIAADGTDLQRESPLGHDEFRPEWSPDGETLLTLRHPGSAVLRSAGVERLLAGIRVSRWSPDQSKLLVDADERVVTFDLASETQVDLGVGASPMWRPGGQRIP